MKGLLFILLLLAGPAQAHKLKLFVTAEGAVISGAAYFSGGAKAAGLGGTVLAPDGSTLAEIRTGEDGGFRFEAKSRMDHAIVVDGGDGHAASAVVTAAELPESLPPGIAGSPRPPPATADTMAVVPVEAIEAAVARQIQPLRRQLDAYEDKVRLHDILGGVGMIFGLFGVAAWWSAGRRKP
ncbi:hypothetical protein [Magnetospirillum sp. SS-4]|uniref:hypothetical protein n=1 Tax=Magnetospirillum sp. SS-4 TaxID=2681465 RepID=UPI001385834F|nr:hypothetical protein [Magnetospirillum sp. SS-4]CAA7615582.1 conserved exported hypothetical protein [Magnetospirillum sp. SS-4]